MELGVVDMGNPTLLADPGSSVMCEVLGIAANGGDYDKRDPLWLRACVAGVCRPIGVSC